METFFTTSEKIQHIIKSFNLTKTLFVSSIIIGDAHTGKKTLARYLFPDIPIVSGSNQEEVKLALETYDALIITDFEKLPNPRECKFDNKRIIATANYTGNPSIIDELFAFIYKMPSLIDRPDDIDYLKDIFIQEAIEILMIEKKPSDITNISLDLSHNTKSLKKSIYTYLTKYAMNKQEIEDLLYDYFFTQLDGNDAYRKHLGVFEKPLIKAGLEKYGSQLQLSQVLGINRNTLRKKIHEHKIN